MKSLLLGALVSLSVMATAAAQSYPTKPIRLVVPYPAGGTTDILARAINQPMSDILGQPVVIENKPGAGGIIGTETVAKSAPDGYTLVFGNLGPNAINQSLYPNLPYDPVKDFAPISVVANMPLLLVAHPEVPVKNVADLIAAAKAKPGSLSFASVGPGSASHVTGELFNRLAGVSIVHVPYKGGAPAVNDLIGGHVPLMYVTGLEGTPHIKGGRMKLLGITTKDGSSIFPEASPIAKTVPGFDVGVWFGVLAPAGTPPEIVAKLNDAIRKSAALPEVQQKLTALGAEPTVTTPAEFAKLIANEVEKWGKVVKEAGIRLN